MTGSPALAALEIGVGHVAGDGAGADDGDLDDEVVEVSRLVARQRGHLRAALDLEDPGGVGGADHLVGLGVVGGQVGEIDLGAFVGADHGDGLLEGVEHPEAEEVDLDDPEIGAVVLVPLDDGAVLHGGGLERDHLVEPALGDHHPARVLAEVAGEVVDLPPQPFEVLDAVRGGVEPDGGELGVEGAGAVLELRCGVVAEALGEPADLVEVEAERLADLARR